MSSTYTRSQAETFTITNAEYLASKVRADLQRFNRFYGSPPLSSLSKYDVGDYERELILLQQYNYLYQITYGFISNNQWVKAVRYSVSYDGSLTTDDDPGGFRYSEIPFGSSFTSVLTNNHNWEVASFADRQSFESQSPVKRSFGSGYGGEERFTQQKVYSSGGRSLARSGI